MRSRQCSGRGPDSTLQAAKRGLFQVPGSLRCSSYSPSAPSFPFPSPTKPCLGNKGHLSHRTKGQRLGRGLPRCSVVGPEFVRKRGRSASGLVQQLPDLMHRQSRKASAHSGVPLSAMWDADWHLGAVSHRDLGTALVALRLQRKRQPLPPLIAGQRP